MTKKPVEPHKEKVAEYLRGKPSQKITNDPFFGTAPVIKLRGELKEELRQVFIRDRGKDTFETQEELLLLFLSMGLRQWQVLSVAKGTTNG